MDFSKLTTDQLEHAADMLKAMAHPMRVGILSLLDNAKTLTVNEITEKTGLEQSTTSHHLGILKNKGILGSRRDGKNTYYFVKNDNLGSLLECLSRCSCKE